MRRTTLAALAVLASSVAAAQAPSTAPSVSSGTYQWHDLATLAGAVTGTVTLSWEVDTSSGVASDYFEVLVAWLERPSQTRRWVLQSNDVQISDTANPSVKRISVDVKVPGAGHFSFQQRNCLNPVPPSTTPTCSAWANSFDPAVSRVNGQPRAWWVYGYLEPLPAPIPVE